MVVRSGMETAGWMRSEGKSMRRITERLSMVRVLALLLKGRCGTREVGLSELWMKVSGGRMEKLLIVS